MTTTHLRTSPRNGQGSLAYAAETTRLGYVGRQPGTAVRDSDAWFTPAAYIESARAVMGSIDFDPFSSALANTIVQATHYLHPEKSALQYPWRPAPLKRRYPHGMNVWMNPPYGASILADAIEAFLQAQARGDIAQAIVLVNNATETQWFARLRAVSQAVCFPMHRIAFTNVDGKAEGGNTRAQAFFYSGDAAHADQFITGFQRYGWVLHHTRGWA